MPNPVMTTLRLLIAEGGAAPPMTYCLTWLLT
jgi:hypothetical protein